MHRATPSLRSLIHSTQAEVPHPQGGTISDHTAEDVPGILGSGSDVRIACNGTDFSFLVVVVRCRSRLPVAYVDP